MSALQNLNARTLEFRKARDPLAATFQQIMAGATASAKARGLDEAVTDADATAALKKAEKNVRDMLAALGSKGVAEDDPRYQGALNELRNIESLLPAKASADDIRAAAEQHLSGVADRNMKAMGGTMAHLRATFGDSLDNAEASQIVKSLLS